MNWAVLIVWILCVGEVVFLAGFGYQCHLWFRAWREERRRI